MSKRVPGSMRIRQSLFDLIDGRLSSPDGRAELVRLAPRLIVEETLEAENRDAVGRAYDEHGAAPEHEQRHVGNRQSEFPAHSTATPAGSVAITQASLGQESIANV